ncbi:MAG: primosomal protein N' [Bacillota bacterium]
MSGLTRYAEVVVDLAPRHLDRIFHYSVPNIVRERIYIGTRVEVSFGSRLVEGYVVGFTEKADVTEVKEISRVLDGQPIDTEKILLARWMAERYLCPLVVALRCMLPPGQRGRESRRVKVKLQQAVWLAVEPEQVKQLLQGELSRSPRQAELLRLLAEKDGRLIKDLVRETGSGRGSLKTLVEKGYLRMEWEEISRSSPSGYEDSPLPDLLPEQSVALQQISRDFRRCPQTLLLHGVTGSGKTEVYLRAISMAMGQGKGAIVLVPEISLTPQTAERFKARFGDQVAVLHSALSPGERYDEWRRINNGDVQVVVGARSAVFAPIKQLGIIVIDEEHETSYKQDVDPKYHTREVAWWRARYHKALLILGSATPSLESFYRAESGVYGLLRMQQRVYRRPLPKVRVVDMREELKAGNRSIFSRALQDSVSDALARECQVILFLNRRGFHSSVVCRECGLSFRCPRCDVALTLHAGDKSLRCHYCHFHRQIPGLCPRCGSKYVKGFGIGTQRVEEESCKCFPGSRVVRMDVDTTSQKGAHQQILRTFRKGEANILVGTQMVAKGLDIPRVTVVGVIAADITLNLPDFRSRERTFQLLAQVAGRAGRGEWPGEVVIQSYDPANPSILAASGENYLGFYQQEMARRRQLDYPPFTHLIRVQASGVDESRVIYGAQLMASMLQENLEKRELAEESTQVLGPAPSVVTKINNNYRWQVVLKGSRLASMVPVVRETLKELLHQHPTIHRLSFSVDIDPLGLL